MRIPSLLALAALTASCGTSAIEPRDDPDGGAPALDGGPPDEPDAEQLDGGAESHVDTTMCAFAGQHASFRVLGDSIASCATAEGIGAERRDPTKVVGRVVEVTSTSFTIDSCPPGANCLVASTTTVEITAPDLPIPLQMGGFVEVVYLMTRFYACQQSLEVRSVPRWGAEPNPAGPEPTVLLVLVDGGSAFADSPYQVTRQLLSGCRLDAGAACGSITPGDYALVFTPKLSAQPAVSLATGETRTALLQPPLVTAALVVHDLRSYQTVYCDDYWNFAYTMHVTAR